MPRPIIGTMQSSTQNNTILNLTHTTQNKADNREMTKMEIDRILRKKRSKTYMDALHRLDAGGHVCNKNQVDDIINAISGEFPELELAGRLLGFVSICYLGEPYEVHILDVTGRIIEHYKKGKPLPGGLERARVIAMRGGYDFIEVYSDCLRAIGEDGSVSVIPG